MRMSSATPVDGWTWSSEVSMRVLGYCANGLQGQPTVQELLKSGHQVRALVRDGNRASALAAAGAEVVTADSILTTGRILSWLTVKSTTSFFNW
jgi:hypothetical protein